MTGERIFTFYHVSRHSDPELLKSFYNKGALPIGKGVGGQKDGFFVHMDEESALAHILFLDNQLTDAGKTIVIGVDVNESDLKYPKWQFDFEYQAESSLFLIYFLSKHASVFDSKAKDLNIPVGTYFSDKFCEKITCIKSNKNNPTEFPSSKPVFELELENDKFKVRRYWTHTYGPSDSFQAQLVTDWLCANSDAFIQNYNDVLKKIAFNEVLEWGEGLCHSKVDGRSFHLKYVGNKSLPISSAVLYQKAEGDAPWNKTVLYDSNLSKKEQVCPFVMLGMSKSER